MTKAEFEKSYCNRSKISLEEYHKYHVSLPCACEADNCEGWAAVMLDAYFIEDHLEMYAPDDIKRYYK